MVMMLASRLGISIAVRTTTSTTPDIIIITAPMTSSDHKTTTKTTTTTPAPHMPAPFMLPAFDHFRIMQHELLAGGPQIPAPPIAVSLAPPYASGSISVPSLAAAAAATIIMKDMIETARRRAAAIRDKDSDDMIDSSATASDQRLLVENPSHSRDDTDSLMDRIHRPTRFGDISQLME